MTALDRLLQSCRDAAVTEREKGTCFGRPASAYFQNDPVQSEEYEAAWTWADWAKANVRDTKDVGIDLVAKLRDEDGFAAIQAKFFAADGKDANRYGIETMNNPAYSLQPFQQVITVSLRTMEVVRGLPKLEVI